MLQSGARAPRYVVLCVYPWRGRRRNSPALSLADAELQFRVRLGRVIGSGLEKLVRQREFEDGPEGLPVLPRKGAGGVGQVVLLAERPATLLEELPYPQRPQGL